MRRGERVDEYEAEGLTAETIVHAMVGRSVQQHHDKKATSFGEPMLEVRDLHVTGARGIPAVRGVDLVVRAGEILGIAGVEGNGQTELVEAIVGLRGVDRGTVSIGGKAITFEPVAHRYRAGLGHVPEDRHDRALILDYSIQDNLLLGQQRDFTGSFDVLDRDRVRQHADRLIREFDIRPPDPRHLVRSMSGGNQQKLVVARELSRRALSVLICAQPTRGVDIGAIEAIHRRMIEARDRGLAVLLLSAELSELRSLSDRLAVLYKGQIVATLDQPQLAAGDALDKIGAMMTGAWTRGVDGADGGDGGNGGQDTRP
jgi:simple sugar transport system ATP-binding protein